MHHLFFFTSFFSEQRASISKEIDSQTGDELNLPIMSVIHWHSHN